LGSTWDPEWRPLLPTDPDARSGCERVASEINRLIGGSINRIVPHPPAAILGRFMGVNLGWRYHVVVVLDGRVYDAFTGHKGYDIVAYKALWQYADAIEFGF
jgi:hypothetical protein